MSEERDSFVFYPTFYIEAGDGISLKSAYRMNNAITRYGIFGELPDTAGWRQWERIIVDAAIAQIAAQKKNRDNGTKGGRTEKSVTAEDLDAKYAELGNWNDVASFFQISRRTLFNIRREAEQVQSEVQSEVRSEVQEVQSEVQEVQSAKTNVNVKENVNVNEKERIAQCAPVELQAAPALLDSADVSRDSFLFPTESFADSVQPQKSQETVCKRKTSVFTPPSVEEVASYCKERGNDIDAESFVAFYASKGWMVGKNKMKDWRQAVITWEKRGKEQAQNSARASPPAPQYKTWHAEDLPTISEEERAAVAEGLTEVMGKLKQEIIVGG